MLRGLRPQTPALRWRAFTNQIGLLYTATGALLHSRSLRVWGAEQIEELGRSAGSNPLRERKLEEWHGERTLKQDRPGDPLLRAIGKHRRERVQGVRRSRLFQKQPG